MYTDLQKHIRPLLAQSWRWFLQRAQDARHRLTSTGEQQIDYEALVDAVSQAVHTRREKIGQGFRVPATYTIELSEREKARLDDEGLTQSYKDHLEEELEGIIETYKYSVARPLTILLEADKERDHGLHVRVSFKPYDPTVVRRRTVRLAQQPLASFRVRKGTRQGEIIPVFSTPITIGRRETSNNPDVALHEPEISKYHARVQQRGNDFFIMDEGSTNGTWVDGRRIRQHAWEPLGDGSTITLASLIELEFNIEASSVS